MARLLQTCLLLLASCEFSWQLDEEPTSPEVSVCDMDSVHPFASLVCYCDFPDGFQAREAYCSVLRNVTDDHPALRRFASVPNLTSLTLNDRGHGALRSVPRSVFPLLHKLMFLRITNAIIPRVPSGSFANISALMDIDLHDNMIEVVEPLAFSGLPSLRVLTLSDNHITHLRKNTFVDVPSLAKLYIDRNGIQVIEEGALSGLVSLDELELFQNDIQQIGPETFAGLKSLTRLDLQQNMIRKVPNHCFRDLHSLRHLDLGKNYIQFLYPNSFADLHNLLSLKLDGNQLSSLPSPIFRSLPLLFDVDLRKNQLETLPYDTFRPLLDNLKKETMFFRVSENKLVCDCRLHWVWKVVEETSSIHVNSSLRSFECSLGSPGAEGATPPEQVSFREFRESPEWSKPCAPGAAPAESPRFGSPKDEASGTPKARPKDEKRRQPWLEYNKQSRPDHVEVDVPHNDDAGGGERVADGSRTLGSSLDVRTHAGCTRCLARACVPVLLLLLLSPPWLG